jgi:formylglycine-generating enzyme required for sulfatase activity
MPPDPNMPEYFTVWPANALEELAASLTVSLDRYGLYADLGVANASQRFRWLEPGEFLMGSPYDELGRYLDETQHHVTLTQGFWLADTAVTQAFWQAVMGDNPSRFKDNPDNPVEQVSWQDAQAFIHKLNGLFPHLQACLPSEAQWEYACRAGTTTAFSFGSNITTEQVNYNGEIPYANGEKEIYRGKTVPVKSLPPNPWGLYEMHGNVREWCADAWQEPMTAEPVIDPLSTEGDAVALRVVRGGSWSLNGGFVRSAFRLRGRPVNRNYGIGLRLALGPTELRSGGGGTAG